MTDLLYGEIEDDLRSGLRGMLEERCAWQDVLAGTEPAGAEEDGQPGGALWRALVDFGVLALPVPEERGGGGATWRETAVVMEELGRAVAPVPFLTSSVIATAALLAADDELLPALASGERTAVLAVPFGTAPDAPLPDVRVSGGSLTGEVRDV
ncbi:acyl-CoA dehydrogenase family protein, partial [Spirillospora sp. NPDC049652]